MRCRGGVGTVRIGWSRVLSRVLSRVPVKLLRVDWLLRIHLLRRWWYRHAVRLRRHELDVVPVRSRDQTGGIAAAWRRVTEHVRRSHGSLGRHRVNVVVLRWRRVRRRLVPWAAPMHGVVGCRKIATLTVARFEKRMRGIARAGETGTA